MQTTFKILRRSTPLDTSRIKMAKSGFVESMPEDPISPERELESFSPDIDGLEFEDETSPGSTPSPDNMYGHEAYLSRRSTVWCPRVEDNPRIVSQGDLTYDLGQEVYAILPFWPSGNSETVLRRMVVIKGVITNMEWTPVETKDLPREINGRSSPDVSANHISPWAEVLTWNPLAKVNSTKESNPIQTIFTHVSIVLDAAFSHLPLKNEEISDCQHHPTAKNLPYEYNLHITKTTHPKDKKSKKAKGGNRKTTELTIPYHYLLGSVTAVRKIFNTNEDGRIQNWIDKLKIAVGDGIEDLDSGMRMKVVDYYFTPASEIVFVVKCFKEPFRVLNLKKLQAFSVRGIYDHSPYHSFKIIDLGSLKIHSLQSHDCNRLEIGSLLKEAFDKIGIYHVKKSLSGQQDVASRIYEDSHGSSQAYSKHYGDVPEEGLRFTGITLTSYAKGLAYLDGHEPPDAVSYIFFHSRDYYEVDLDPESVTFLELVPAAEKHNLFRNPDPGDIVLAQSFICEKGQYTGKTNLKWFYPSDDFRLLHLFVTKPSLKSALAKTISSKKLESPCLDLYHLLVYGTSTKNPTLHSEFTKTFSKKYFWWL